MPFPEKKSIIWKGCKERKAAKRLTKPRREQSSEGLGGKRDLILFIKWVSQGLYSQNFIHGLTKNIRCNQLSLFLLPPQAKYGYKMASRWTNLMISNFSRYVQNPKHYLTEGVTITPYLCRSAKHFSKPWSSSDCNTIEGIRVAPKWPQDVELKSEHTILWKSNQKRTKPSGFMQLSVAQIMLYDSFWSFLNQRERWCKISWDSQGLLVSSSV